jgi:POT family proton-dependent oligopeptide transporter
MKDMALWNEGDWIAAIAVVVLGAFLRSAASSPRSRKPEFMGHPKGLYMLFFAEMWERFSYYGMRALLIFYLTQHWLFNDRQVEPDLRRLHQPRLHHPGARRVPRRPLPRAAQGGAVRRPAADVRARADGGRRHRRQADMTINVFWLALALIIVGSGFLKANISVMVGQLYRLTDMRRDAAYTIFYMGINAGAALGTILVGYLGQTVGWGFGFGLAGIGMAAGLVVFVLGKKVLLGAGEAPAPLSQAKEFTLYGIGIAAVAVMWALIQFQDVIQTLLIVSGVALLGYVLYESFKLPKEPRERMFAILFLIALNPLFWGLFEQAGGSLNLYTDRFVDIGGVPASLFQSINPIYIILFAPVFAALWIQLGKRGLEPSAPAKFALALAQVGLGFLVFVWGALGRPGVATPVIFVFLLYALHTTGELCLSPVGLSAMNRLAPTYLASLIMGAWFYMTAVGQLRRGQDRRGHRRRRRRDDPGATLAIYNQIGWVALIVSGLVLALSPVVKGWMHLGTLKDREDGLIDIEGPGRGRARSAGRRHPSGGRPER